MTDVYGTLYRNAFLPTWEGVVRRRPTLPIRDQLLASQWWSRDELIAFQTRELRRLVQHAYTHVPYYRAWFDRIGAHPEDVREAADLSKLPILRRSDAQSSAQARKSTAPPLPTITKSTSGSTGEPLVFGYDLGSEHWRQAVKLRGWGWAGWRPAERTLFFWGSLDSLYPTEWKKKAKVALDRWLRRELYVDSNARSEADLARVVETIRSFRPQALICFSQAGAELARFVNETGQRSWGDIRVLCGAERLYPADRAALEQAFGPDVFETYGSREVMLIGSECEAHAGLHLSMENLIVELLVESDGQFRPAEPGELGQVAVTDLHNLGMPFIRYLNGDLAIANAPARCACGRGLDRLASVEGRQNDTLRGPDGRAIDSLFFNVLFSVLGGKVRQFQALQRLDGSVSLRVVAAPSFEPAVLGALDDNCKKFFGAMPVAIELVDHIPIGKNGKRRVVVVER